MMTMKLSDKQTSVNRIGFDSESCYQRPATARESSKISATQLLKDKYRYALKS